MVQDEESDSKYLLEKENQLEGEGEVDDEIFARMEGLANEGLLGWDEVDMEHDGVGYQHAGTGNGGPYQWL